jgi:hypothetical protein
MSWRDDLPPLPTEEMLAEAVDEGRRRIHQRQRRRRAMVLGGVAVVATGLGVATASGVFTNGSEEAERGGVTVAVAPSEAVATGIATEGTSAIEPGLPGETVGTAAATAGTEAAAAAATEPAGTEPAGTEAAGTMAAGTVAAAEDTTPILPAATEPMGTAAAGTAPAGTEVRAATTGPPEIVASGEITVEPVQVWEQPASGPECGPTTVAVTYTPRDRALANAVAIWTGSFGIDQSPMEIVDNIATATIGPFPADTVGTDVVAEPLSVIVVAIATDGTIDVLQPQPVELTLTACPT